jgi:hypothetical protein
MMQFVKGWRKASPHYRLLSILSCLPSALSSLAAPMKRQHSWIIFLVLAACLGGGCGREAEQFAINVHGMVLRDLWSRWREDGRATNVTIEQYIAPSADRYVFYNRKVSVGSNEEYCVFAVTGGRLRPGSELGVLSDGQLIYRSGGGSWRQVQIRR